MASRSSRGVLLVAALAAVALLIVALIAAVGSLNPFGSETKDRSGPVLLKSLEDLSQYRAASANMQVVVDVEQDDKLLPSFIRGERTLFVAAGTVDAAVDFSGLSKDAGAVKVSDDRKAVTITLPAATLTEAAARPVALARLRPRPRDHQPRRGRVLGQPGRRAAAVRAGDAEALGRRRRPTRSCASARRRTPSTCSRG